MPIITEPGRTIVVLGTAAGDIGIVGTSLEAGPRDEINGMAFFEHQDQEIGTRFAPEGVASMPVHLVFTDPEAVTELIEHLRTVRQSMYGTMERDLHPRTREILDRIQRERDKLKRGAGANDKVE